MRSMHRPSWPLAQRAARVACGPMELMLGKSGQILHLSDITHGRISSNLLDPEFGGIGDPGTVDGSRLFQLSFHVRF